MVAAGGISDGRGLAAALAYGAHAVWVGTLFVPSHESTASKLHKQLVLSSSSSNTIRTLIYTGRPLRVVKTDYVMDWEENKATEIQETTARGVLPYQVALNQAAKSGESFSIAKTRHYLCGQCAGSVHEMKSAASIVEDLVSGAISAITTISKL